MTLSWLTLLIVVAMVITLAMDILRPSLAIWATLLLMTVLGIISIPDALVGFSNRGMITVAFLFVVSGALQTSRNVENLIHRLMGKKSLGITLRYLRLLFPVAGLSAFLNNTPIVASLIPMIKSWAEKHRLSASKYLIPLSYAAILGGTCTLIGTSTNLIIHGLLLDHKLPGISFFKITPIALPVTFLIILFISLFGKKLLPYRKDIPARIDEDSKKFVSELVVEPSYRGIGKSIEEAGLRNLPGLFLFQIERKNHRTISPVPPKERIQEGDRLFFTGITRTIFDLQKTRGLRNIKDVDFDLKNLDSSKTQTFEAVISKNSSLINTTPKKVHFRSHYKSAIIAIHRSGKRLNRKIGQIRLKAGDTLFLLAEKDFLGKFRHSKDFSLVSSSVKILEKPRWKSTLGLVFLAGMIAAASLNLVPIVLAAGITAFLMVITRIIDYSELGECINWEVLAIIAGSFGIAQGIENSGLAAVLGDFLVHTLSGLGPVAIIAGTFLLVSSLTMVITNNAAAAMMFPVVLSISQKTGLGMEPFVMVLVMAASTCYASPIGYQTNTMVFGAGGYRFSDFLKIGTIINILVAFIVTLLVAVFYL